MYYRMRRSRCLISMTVLVLLCSDKKSCLLIYQERLGQIRTNIGVGISLVAPHGKKLKWVRRIRQTHRIHQLPVYRMMCNFDLRQCSRWAHICRPSYLVKAHGSGNQSSPLCKTVPRIMALLEAPMISRKKLPLLRQKRTPNQPGLHGPAERHYFTCAW
jgi:hypothetical protein